MHFKQKVWVFLSFTYRNCYAIIIDILWQNLTNRKDDFMTIKEISEILHADVLCCEENTSHEVHTACGSDMMSDVLAFVKNQSVLLTGLCNPQVVRTAEMMDIICIVFVRGKQPDENMLELAKERGIPLLSTKHRMFNACGMLYDHGLRGGDIN